MGGQSVCQVVNRTDLVAILKTVPDKCHQRVLVHGFLDYHEQFVCLCRYILGSQRSRRRLTKLCIPLLEVLRSL